MRPFRPITLVALIAGILVLSASCGKKEEQAAGPEKAEGPVATARQAISTPTLAQPEAPEEGTEETEEEPPAETQEAPPAEAAKAPPRGPITLPPQPTKEPAPAPEAPSEAAVATVGEAPSEETGEALKALAAPGVAPAEPAKPEEAQPVAYEPKLVTAETNVDVVLDASGSMAAPFAATSKTKFDVLREAFYDIIYEMGQQQEDYPRNVAVRLFGSEDPASERSCDDTTLIAPMGEPNLSGIRSVLDEVTAQGTSPIARAIAASAGDFPAGAPADRVIVLVADGGDNCEGDPCAAAKALEAGTAKSVINVVAFDISPGDEASLKCIAEAGDGKYFLARNEAELRRALTEAVNASAPYNLKLTALAGITPIPFSLTVFRAGTEEVVKRDTSFGTKLLSMAPGTYDILVEYSESPESKKPSKILKGVEILATTKAEQTITFDLGQLALSAVDTEGKLVPAQFELQRQGADGVAAAMQVDAEEKNFFLTPGTYDITAELIEGTPEERFTLVERGVAVKVGETAEGRFRFQKGTLALKGVTTQKQAIPFLFQAYKAGRADILIASGAFPTEGGSVLLPPGNYDLLVVGTDPEMAASPRTKVSGVEVKAADTTAITATFEMGTLELKAIDGKGNKLPAEFVITDAANQLLMATLISEGGQAVEVALPPGSYDVVASSLKSQLEPKPAVPVDGIAVTPEKPVQRTIKFVLGTLRLRGSNAKEQPVRTQFTIYRAASDEVVSKAPPSKDWMVFDLAPGTYDALGVNQQSEEDTKPMIWLRDITVEDGKSVSHEAIFTAGRLKIICRGPNNKIIQCHFKIFKYGRDSELINGVTGDDWEVFEIEPGRYYLEASYHDEQQSVLLKKWINIAIGENEVVEEVLRF